MPFATVPSSTGPLAPLAELVARAPGTAAVGEWVRVSVTVRIRASGPRMITTPGTSALLVVSGGRVIARRDGPTGTGAVPLIVRAGAVAPAQAVPDSIRLHDGDAPLPSGGYAIVAVLGYRSDSLNTGTDAVVTPPTGWRGFVLVSAPVTLEVH